MSLMYARLSNDNILVAADTRIATTLSDGRTIVKGTECEKLIVLNNVDGNNIVFFKTGRLEVVDSVLNEVLTPINNRLDLSNERITAVCKKWHNIYINGCKQYNIEPETNNEGIVTSCGLCMLRYDREVDKMVITYFMPHSDFAAQRVESRPNMVGSLFAGVWDEFKPNAKEWNDANEVKYNDKIDLIRNLYKHCNNVHVGGHLQIYRITKTGIENVLFEEIPDKEEYPKETVNHAMLNNNVVIQWSGIENVLEDNMPAVAMSGDYNDLSNKPSIPTLPSYIKSTKITSTTIESPSISGGNIYGGTYWNGNAKAYFSVGTSSGNYGDFSLYSQGNATPRYQIFDDANTIEFRALGNMFMHSSGNNTYPSGTWNFSNATVTGLSGSMTPKFG